MKEIELKPCPFCGGKADFIAESATIKCKQCGGAFIVTNPLISRLEVAQAWNGRIAKSNERCIVCDEIIPEGRQVCPKCEELH